jgi:predicted  nucleic acid-binding Zn-ribbon protein
MVTKKNKLDTVATDVMEAVAEQHTAAIATVLGAGLAKVQSEQLAENMAVSHRREYAALAIDSAVDEDKDALEMQLDTLRKATTTHQKELEKNKAALKEASGLAEEDVVKSVVLPHYAKNAAFVNSIPGVKKVLVLTGDYEGDRKKVECNCHLPDPKERTEEKKAGGVFWSYTLRDDTGHRNTIITVEGSRKLPTEVVKLLKERDAIEKKIAEVESYVGNIRLDLQNLERERASLRRKLDRETLNSSATGAELLKAVKGMRVSSVKALPSSL